MAESELKMQVRMKVCMIRISKTWNWEYTWMRKPIIWGCEILHFLKENERKKLPHFISVKEALKLHAEGGDECQDLKQMGFKMEWLLEMLGL